MDKWLLLQRAESDSSSKLFAVLLFHFASLLLQSYLLSYPCASQTEPVLLDWNVIFFVSGYSNWDVCADMIGSFTDTEDPAKFKMKYWGVASFLQKGSEYLTIEDAEFPGRLVMLYVRAGEGKLLNFLNTLKRHNNYHIARFNVNKVITTFLWDSWLAFFKQLKTWPLYIFVFILLITQQYNWRSLFGKKWKADEIF